MINRYRHRLIMLLAVAGGFSARSNPTGGAVAAGSAGISGQGTSAVTVNQASNTAIINWQTFSIGAGELTKFIQPSSSSATLNRVLGGQTSFIEGTLSANGQVYLLNGNGIVVGPGGVINTAGFTGSTRDISDSDFLSGHLHFVGGSQAGVQNLGTINALGGDVVLIGKTVDNAGTINASGTAGLVAGDDVLLAQNNPDGSTITVNPVSAPTAAATQVGVHNSGTITASSAELKAANGNIYALAIQNEGIVRATTVTRQGGHIYLTSDSGAIVNSGTLDASATAAGGQGGTVIVKSTSGSVVHSGTILAHGGQGGAGGNAEISGAQIGFTGLVDLTSPDGTTGNLLLDPSSLTVVAGTGGTVDTITPGNDQNDSGPSTIGASLVGTTLATASLTLSATSSITVSSEIDWDAATKLTLQTAGSIAINAAINAGYNANNSNAAPLGSLTVDAGTQVGATGAIRVANFILQGGSWVQNVAPALLTGASQLPAFTASHDFEIQGGTFLRTSGGDGSSTHPYQLVDIYGVQGMSGFLGSDANLGPNATTYAVIDASSTATWNGGLGFLPIGFATANGSLSHPYTGVFADTGGEIDDLTIARPTANDVGLIADLQGTLYYVNLNGVAITGNNNVGGLVGLNEGTIFNASISGGTVTGVDDVGFIAGDNENSISYCYVNSGTVTGTSVVGGVAGLNDSQIEGGSSGGTVNGGSEVGGIAGENDGTVDSASNYASVNGNAQVGGIVGLNTDDSTVSGSTNNGAITGTDTVDVQSTGVGGLVGQNDGTVTGSSSSSGSSVNGDLNVGGLVGYNTGTISDTPTQGSYNSGTVTGNASTISGDAGSTDIGGVAGLNTGTIQDSYNIGTVSGATNVGGIAGENEQLSFNVGDETVFLAQGVSDQSVFTSPGIIQTSYNSGTVHSGSSGSSSSVGGIVGMNDSGATVTTCYNLGVIGDGSSTTVGGIAGINYGTVEYTYNSGSVTGTGSAGLVGADENGATTIASYWDETTSGQSAATHAFGDLTETNLVALDISGGLPSPYAAASYANFDNGASQTQAVAGTNGVYSLGSSPDGSGASWYIIDGQTRPLLAMEQSTNIQNAHQLQLMAENLNGSYAISQSIDASGTSGGVNDSEIWNPATGFVPVGQGLHAFAGSLNGDSTPINALFIDRSGTDDVGLIGYSTGALSNIYLTNISITGDNDVGAVVGLNLGTVSTAQVGSATDDTSTITALGQAAGGVVGLNGTTGNVLTGNVSESLNYAQVQGPTSVGGIAGQNAPTGVITESINYGAIGTDTSVNAGGLVGRNQGQVDDSYSTASASVTGASNVGGLVGLNDTAGTLETSYSTTPVTGPGNIFDSLTFDTDTDSSSGTTGALVGDNEGIIRHAYWQNDNGNSGLPGIGTDNGQTTDAVGYTGSQLTNIGNYAQGASPVLWDFSPQPSNGVWGVNVYDSNGAVNPYTDPSTQTVVGGLPVLQWQTPVNVEVAVASATVLYGTPATYTATGAGASNLTTYVNPNNGPTLTLSNPTDRNAGSQHEVTLSGNPIYGGYNVEYVNGTLAYNGSGQQVGVTPTVTIVPADLTITAGSATIAPGQSPPTPTSTFSGFAYGENQSTSDLTGNLVYSYSPALSPASGSYSILQNGLSSSNYNLVYVAGRLTITGDNTGFENQPVSTVETELTSITNQFGNDPFNGLDPLSFLTIPDVVGLEGDFLGAINNEGATDDILYISSTSSLPALSRLVTPGTGIVTIGDGFVVVGNPRTGAAIYLDRNPQGLPGGAIAGLRSVLSPAAFNALRALIYGHY